MKKNNMVGYNVSLYDCPNPQEFWNVAKPKNCIDSIWIPQTIGDQIWMWFEFDNEDEKNEYIKQISKINNLKVIGYYDNLNAQGYRTRKKQTTSVRKIFNKSKEWFDHFTQKEILIRPL